MRDHATYTYLSTFLTYICTTQAYFGQPGYYQQGFQPRYPGVQQIQQGYGYGIWAAAKHAATTTATSSSNNNSRVLLLCCVTHKARAGHMQPTDRLAVRPTRYHLSNSTRQLYIAYFGIHSPSGCKRLSRPKGGEFLQPNFHLYARSAALYDAAHTSRVRVAGRQAGRQAINSNCSLPCSLSLSLSLSLSIARVPRAHKSNFHPGLPPSSSISRTCTLGNSTRTRFNRKSTLRKTHPKNPP